MVLKSRDEHRIAETGALNPGDRGTFIAQAVQTGSKTGDEYERDFAVVAMCWRSRHPFVPGAS
jgi:hypothetical protein